MWLRCFLLGMEEASCRLAAAPVQEATSLRERERERESIVSLIEMILRCKTFVIIFSEAQSFSLV